MSDPLIITPELLEKYNIPGPRYTSYPTAPNWSEKVNHSDYQNALKNTAKKSDAISLYIHIPFCEKQCTFCACMVKIRENKPSVGNDYLDLLFQEIDILDSSLIKSKKVVQLHLGGGTPNFLSPAQITSLWNRLEQSFDIDPTGEISIEIDPRTLILDHLSIYRKLGFNRISMGIQDFDIRVQRAINRIQPLEQVQRIFEKIRQLNFTSVNCDLVYGLPFQTEKGFEQTSLSVSTLHPDRIALYSFAYVPWMKKHQKLISKESLPTPKEKISIFLKARQIFLKHEYKSIGMDHFALEKDAMCQAFMNQKLYRNFMGYTLRYTQDFVGIGLSAIGFVDQTFIQNHKDFRLYRDKLYKKQLPTERGKILTHDDKKRLWVIFEFICHFHINKLIFQNKFSVNFDKYFSEEKDHLDNCQKEKLLIQNEETISVTEKGKLFIRNICIGFDDYFKTSTHNRFSQTI